MRKFIKNLALFSLIFILIMALKKYITPYYLGDLQYSSKLKYYKKNKNEFNTVIFGSSRLYRHIDPNILDSLLIGKGVHSFNFATREHITLRVTFYMKNLLQI